MQQMQDKAKESCMVSFQLLHSHLKVLSNNDLKRTQTGGGFERAFATLFDQDVQTFTSTMLLNLDELEKQLDKEEFQEIGSMDALRVLKTQFQTFINSQFSFDDDDGLMIRKAQHKQEYDSRVNKRQMQTKEGKVDLSKALDASLVVTESTLKFGQHSQILNETSNKAKIKKEIEVLEKINIELEHSVAKLLEENEKLHEENEHLKQTYKDLYDSIKKTRVRTKDYNDSLITQINSKTVENANLKAQIQEKVFANVALKNKLRKLKGNSVDTKFAKPSIIGKPVLQPPRNQSVVRQSNAFKSE
ncbi:hypothetical protein Tco_0414408 [Tanacetum coccineum]